MGFSDFDIIRKNNNFIGISTGRSIDLCDFFSAFNMLTIDKFKIYTDAKYYFPIQIEMIEGDDIAFQKIGVGKIDRYSMEVKATYGESLKIGGNLKIEYYRFENFGLEFFENLFGAFFVFQNQFGSFYGEFFNNKDWQLAYFYEFCLNKLRNGVEISTFSTKDNIFFKLKSYFSTFSYDLKIGFSYLHNTFLNNAFPFELFVSKFYENFELGFIFSPSDVIDSSFMFSVSYYFNTNLF